AGFSPLDYRPGRLSGAGLTKCVLGYLAKSVVKLEVLPINASYPPACMRVFLQTLQSLSLLILGEMKPELEDQSALIGQHLFKTDNPFHGLVQFGVLRIACNMVNNRRRVPGAEKYANLSPGWERPPEPPHPRALKLLVGWCIKGACLNMAGVHPLVENIDRLPLARAIDTGNDDDYREIGLLEIELGIEQRLPQLGHLLPVPLLVDFVPELRRL